MASNFTPGPWEYRPCGDSDGFTIGIDHFVFGNNGEVELACPSNEADARLIAAAPELLAKSQRLIEIMEIQEKRHCGEFHLSAAAFYPMWEEAKNEAKNAIAKATGKEQP